MVNFTVNDDSLVIGGNNTFNIKDDLKKMGARWNPDLRAWVFPLHMDTKELRKQVKTFVTVFKEKAREEERQKQIYNASPEGMAAIKAERKASMRALLEEDKKRMARGEQPFYWYICCEDCELLSSRRGQYHTCCWTCAEWNGAWWEPFRMNGGRHTGD
jgi:hypothetical protein